MLDEKMKSYAAECIGDLKKLIRELAVIPSPSHNEDLRVEYLTVCIYVYSHYFFLLWGHWANMAYMPKLIGSKCLNGSNTAGLEGG